MAQKAQKPNKTSKRIPPNNKGKKYNVKSKENSARIDRLETILEGLADDTRKNFRLLNEAVQGVHNANAKTSKTESKTSKGNGKPFWIEDEDSITISGGELKQVFNKDGSGYFFAPLNTFRSGNRFLMKAKTKDGVPIVLSSFVVFADKYPEKE